MILVYVILIVWAALVLCIAFSQPTAQEDFEAYPTARDLSMGLKDHRPDITADDLNRLLDRCIEEDPTLLE